MKQKSIAGKDTGSLMNLVMGNNDTLPQVGKGCTLLMWTDRHAYEVMEVSEDSKRVVIQKYVPKRLDTNAYSENQNYEYSTLSGSCDVIVWKWGAWRRENKTIQFTEEYAKTIGPSFFGSEEHAILYPNNATHPILIDGKTELKVSYEKVNIIWGVKDEYYDYSF
jgi:hypothetical protein